MENNTKWQLDHLPPITVRKDSFVSETGTEMEVRKRIRFGKPVEAACGLFAEYCSNSTIHGVRYLGDRKRHWSERVWWIIVFGISIYGCGSLILNIWDKWNQSPVIVSFAERSTPVWQIPFPAVTICPETKAKTGLLNFTEIYHLIREAGSSYPNLTDEQSLNMDAVAQICDDHLLANTSFGVDELGPECVEAIRRLSVPFDEMLFFCKWRNSADVCTDLFSEILTEEGICYTFNILNSPELFRESGLQSDYEYFSHNKSSPNWSLEDGYSKEASMSPYPVRVLGAGSRAGLFVLLRLYEYDLDYICRGPVQGFKVILHTPGEVPQVSKQYFRVPLNQEVVVSVKPQMMTTSEGLKYYSPTRRQCYFNDERYLKYFKVYTQQNCQLECLTNFTLSRCGCVKFSMPRHENTSICGAAKIPCLSAAADALLAQEMTDGIASLDKNMYSETVCNCLPSCTSIQYDAELSQAYFNWESLFIAFKNPVDEYPGVQFSRLSIFFKEPQFITSRRSELYGQTDFLANCGGLLGLFMGVSLLSLVEIIYFTTIHLICNLRTRRIRKKRDSTTLSTPAIKVDKPMEGAVQADN